MEYIPGNAEYTIDFLFDGERLVHMIGRRNSFGDQTHPIKGHGNWGSRSFFHPNQRVASLLENILRPGAYVGIGCFQYKMKGEEIKVTFPNENNRELLVLRFSKSTLECVEAQNFIHQN